MGQWSQAGQGAAGGAMTGAALGSVVPGVGTAIGAGAGAVLGGLAGYFGDQGGGQYQDLLKQLATKYGNRAAPQAGPAATGSLSQFRGNQAALIAQLEAMGRGEGPSAAAIQMREAMDRAAGAQASAMAGAGGRGVNAGAAFRQATNNTAAVTAQGARDTAALRAQEQFNALAQLGGVINQGRVADEGMSQFNAGQMNDMARANLQAKIQALGINTEAELNALLGAIKAAGPGLGTQLLAGGATAFPSMLGRKPTPNPADAGGFTLGPSGTTVGPFVPAGQFAPGFNFNSGGGFGNS